MRELNDPKTRIYVVVIPVWQRAYIGRLVDRDHVDMCVYIFTRKGDMAFAFDSNEKQNLQIYMERAANIFKEAA